MVYSNNCVLCLLINGKPTDALANGTVPLPFGVEYKIRLRNKDKKRRVVAKVFVDGENVAEGGVIIPPGSYVDLDGPVNTHKNFKFVSLESPDAIDFGKNGPNHDKTKGVVEARFHFEKEQPQVTEVHHHHHHDYWWPRPWRPYYGVRGLADNDLLRGNSINMVGPASASFSASLDGVKEQSLAPTHDSFCPPTADLKDGCTVEGGHTSQSFGTAYVDYEETATVLKMFLQGFEKAPTVAKRSTSAEFARQAVESRKHAAEAAEPAVDQELEDLKQRRIELEKQLEKKRIAELEAELGSVA